ncbi:MAG: hypothetical protein IJ997_01180 [Mycoplasmataceae bacterium]|nr:hypothetical protein [Mycoplasmataceae bacterium]
MSNISDPETIFQNERNKAGLGESINGFTSSINEQPLNQPTYPTYNDEDIDEEENNRTSLPTAPKTISLSGSSSTSNSYLRAPKTIPTSGPSNTYKTISSPSTFSSSPSTSGSSFNKPLSMSNTLPPSPLISEESDPSSSTPSLRAPKTISSPSTSTSSLKAPKTIPTSGSSIKFPASTSGSSFNTSKTITPLSTISSSFKAPINNKLTPVMTNDPSIRELIKFSNNKMSMNPIYTNMPLSSFTNDPSHNSQKIAIMPIPFVYTLDWTALNDINNIDYPINKITEVNFNDEENIINEEGIINDETIIKQNMSINKTSEQSSEAPAEDQTEEEGDLHHHDEDRYSASSISSDRIPSSYTVPSQFFNNESTSSGLASSMNRPSGPSNKSVSTNSGNKSVSTISGNKSVSSGNTSSYTVPSQFFKNNESTSSGLASSMNRPSGPSNKSVSTISGNKSDNADEDRYSASSIHSGVNPSSYTVPSQFFKNNESTSSGFASSMRPSVPSSMSASNLGGSTRVSNLSGNKSTSNLGSNKSASSFGGSIPRNTSARSFTGSMPASNLSGSTNVNRSSYTVPSHFFNDEEDENYLRDSNPVTSFKEIEEIISPIDYDPANTLTHLEFIERMNVEDVEHVKEFVDANQTTGIFKYPESTSAFITDLMNKREDGSDEIINRVTYSTYHPFMSGIEVPGRLRCSKNSVFNLQRLIRNSLINNNYIDVDMVNAHLNILKNILNIYLPNYKSDKNFKYIDVLISQRNDLIKRMKWLFMHNDNTELSKLDCKNFIFGAMYSYQRFDKVIANSKITNQKIEDLISHTEIIKNDEKNNIRVFSYFFLKWFIKKDNDIHLNTDHLNDPNYNMRLTNFVVLWNNISNSIRNIQIFITLLHENGVRMTAENKNYSIGKKFTKESHSYISSSNNRSIVYREKDKYYEISDDVFADDDIRVVPNVIPPSTTHNLYFYLYNTSIRQQLRHRCFDDDNNIEADDKIYYKTDILEDCYINFNVMFRLIMNEYEKTMLWHCINYTMKKLNIDDNLHAVLCHDGFMLDREYFEDGRLDYTTYLCDLKNYIEEETGFNVNLEYKDHCDEMIDTIDCVNAAANYSCDDSHNYNKKYDENNIYIPKSKKQIASITEKWNISNPDTVTEKVNNEEVTRDIYKMYYNADNNNYYHFANNKPTQPNDDLKYNKKKSNTRIEYDEEADRKGNFEYSDITEIYPSYEIDNLIVFDKDFNEYFE